MIRVIRGCDPWLELYPSNAASHADARRPRAFSRHDTLVLGHGRGTGHRRGVLDHGRRPGVVDDGGSGRIRCRNTRQRASQPRRHRQCAASVRLGVPGRSDCQRGDPLRPVWRGHCPLENCDGCSAGIRLPAWSQDRRRMVPQSTRHGARDCCRRADARFGIPSPYGMGGCGRAMAEHAVGLVRPGDRGRGYRRAGRARRALCQRVRAIRSTGCWTGRQQPRRPARHAWLPRSHVGALRDVGVDAPRSPRRRSPPPAESEASEASEERAAQPARSLRLSQSPAVRWAA